MKIVAITVMALSITLVGTGNATSVLHGTVPLCDEGIVMEGGCCGAPIVGWYTTCHEDQGSCSSSDVWNSGCDSLCCEGGAWVVEESCVQCWRV